jgi:hypothetical protein
MGCSSVVFGEPVIDRISDVNTMRGGESIHQGIDQ